jgi:adenine phosphoribosyltransferase
LWTILLLLVSRGISGREAFKKQADSQILGGSAAAAGSLVRKLGGDLVGFLFMMELDFLQGRAKLDAPVHTLLSGQEESLEASKEKLPLGQTKESADEVKPVADAGGVHAEQRP